MRHQVQDLLHLGLKGQGLFVAHGRDPSEYRVNELLRSANGGGPGAVKSEPRQR
jgi:hypothetical protein